MTIDITTITHSDFEAMTGQVFEVETTQGHIDLTLESIDVPDNIAPRDNHLEIDGKVLPPRQTFSLIFSGPKTPVMEGQSYYVSHEKLGKQILFLSPIESKDDLPLYESVFT